MQNQIWLILAVLTTSLAADPGVEPPVVPFDSGRWQIEAREHRLEEHLGRPSLFLKGGEAWIKDADLLDGIIEFDVAFSGERGFVGAIWRVQDPDDFEEFYLRPHQSGKPDANQYTPVFNGLAGWQLYHGEGYGAPVTYAFDQWMHVKIVFSGKRGEIYIEDMKTPAVVIHEMLREPRAGKVGLMAGNFAPAHFSGFRYRESESVRLEGEPLSPPAPQPGTITHWMISEAFAETAIADAVSLATPLTADRTWTRLAADRSGITNLARVQGLGRGADTAFARVTLSADRPTTRRLDFGYSDRIRVYLNGRLLYAGNNGYRSRDFRYLGTIGYFDSIYLPLNEGANELWMAVSESFGGWGVLARLDSVDGIDIVIDAR